MLVTAHDIVRECSAALKILSEGSSGVDMRAHVLAMLALSKAQLLPPPQQSLSTLGANLDTALRSLEHTDAMLKDVSSLISFRKRPDGRDMDPSMLKAALGAAASVRSEDAVVIARAAESFLVLHATSEESTFLNPLLMRIVPFFPGTSLLDTQCGSGLRVIQAARRMFESGTTQRGTGMLRVSMEEDDRSAECRTRLMMYVCGMNATIAPEGTAFSPGAMVTREYDRMFVQATDRVPDIPGVLRRMGDHSTCVLILSDLAAGCIKKKDMALLLDRDVLVGVITLRSAVRAPWHLMILKGRKPVERRHRVLFYDHEDPFDGNDIDAISADTIAEALERFASTGHHCRVLHRSDVLSKNEEGLTDTKNVTFDPFPLLGLSPADFVALDLRCAERGFDVHSLFTFSPLSYRYEPSVADKRLIPIAVASAPALKNAEVRTHYSFAVWWAEAASLLGSVDAPVMRLHSTFRTMLSADNILLPRQTHHMFLEWWSEIDVDRTMLARHGATALMRSHIDSLIVDATTKGTDFWFETDASRRSLLWFLCPQLVGKLSDYADRVVLLDQRLEDAAYHAPNNITELMAQRRDELLVSRLRYSEFFEIVAHERMHELRTRMEELNGSMATLHSRAKENTTDERRRQQYDATLSLQDSVAGILTQLVPARSELKLLERSIAHIEDLKRKREDSMEQMEDFVRDIIPALSEIRTVMTSRQAESLTVLHFRELLSQRIEAGINANRDALIAELDALWSRFEEGAERAVVEA